MLSIFCFAEHNRNSSEKKKTPKTLQNFYYTSGDVLGEDNHTFFVQGLFFVWWSIKVLMIFPMSLNFKI